MEPNRESLRKQCDQGYRKTVSELEERGRSQWLEEFLEKMAGWQDRGSATCAVVDYAIIRAVHRRFCGDRRDTNFMDRNNPNIPGIIVNVSTGCRRSYTWREAERDIVLEIEVEGLRTMLTEILNEAGRLRQNACPQSPEAPRGPEQRPEEAAPRTGAEDTKLRRQLEEREIEILRLQNQLKQQRENLAIMQRTNDELQNRDEQARAERERLLDEARTEAARLLAAAQTKAAEEQVHRLGEWEQERENLLQAARAECDRQLEEARQASAAAGQQAREESARLLEAARLQAKEEAQRAAARYLAAEQARHNEEQCAVEAAPPDRLQEQAERLDSLRDDMVESSRAIQRRMVQQMDQIESMMQQIKHGIEDDLVGWRRSFFREKYYNIANCYVTLYRQTGAGSRIARMIAQETLRLDRAADAAAAEPAGSELLADLQALHRNMLALQRNLEKAMGQLGLYVAVPQEGEPFADEWHVMEDETEQAAEGTPIASCVTPAVGVRGSDGQSGECVLRAAVTVKHGK